MLLAYLMIILNNDESSRVFFFWSSSESPAKIVYLRKSLEVIYVCFSQAVMTLSCLKSTFK